MKPKVEHYNFDFYKGVTYRIDYNKPMGNRISEVRVQKQLISPEKVYHICMNNYLSLIHISAGAADWVIDGGFSDYAQGLADEGYFVQELRKETPITYEDLVGYDSFIIPEANIPFKVEEQDAIEQ